MAIAHILSNNTLKMIHMIFLEDFVRRFVFGIAGVHGSLSCLSLEDSIGSYSCPVSGIFISRSTSVLAKMKKWVLRM